ncbi:DNA-deoxyinosine glycosylase [Mycolicibacterium sp. 018/SC-01/001]|uniref:DNA-deoxyinosine glycosylase n=1 Tax=Mycolicibacterium sp. 018/SC-01/001 TaxID=2592069 RepID=UPI00117F4424|nr:DNA-deoxyinosine glycosylase [Mycolicibacterium sp. 018/SC-01/001]TRW80929.1 DNA-deoxyinosine glycosylase [Mycolicibacterium sp. 018/SC-01/001]
MASPTVHSFPPLTGEHAEVVILGNMPGVISLQQHQYYAHPRNAFWRIMASLFDFDATAPYDERVRRLTGAGVAVWDVLASCRRVGSLDAAVEPASMVANDFDAFFTAHPHIDRVYFNGAAAATNFQRLVHTSHPVRATRLPSTSPAYTAPFDAKLAAWRQITE